MAKLNQLLTLESMLQTYDNMNICDEVVAVLQAKCIGELVEKIVTMLKRLLESNVRLGFRNVLVTHYDTMKDLAYWLKYKIFNDLPQAASKALRNKVEQMVELIRELILKLSKVDADYADKFFSRLKKCYQKKQVTDYELWKARLSAITMDALTEYQMILTTKILNKGILEYDLEPSDEAVEEVMLERVQKKLKHGTQLTVDFRKECAKLRRYSHWEDDMLIIDYVLLRDYMFKNCGKLKSEQLVALFEYDVQMRMLHEDMVKLKPELARHLNNTTTDDYNYFAIKKNLKVMLESREIASLFSSKQYNMQWMNNFVDDLMKSECKNGIAEKWKNPKRRLMLKCAILGTLKDVGILKGSYRAIALLICDRKEQAETLAKYMGYGKKLPCFEWIADYVK